MELMCQMGSSTSLSSSLLSLALIEFIYKVFWYSQEARFTLKIPPRSYPWNFKIFSLFVRCDTPLLSGVPFPDKSLSFKDGTFSVNFAISSSVQIVEFDFF